MLRGDDGVLGVELKFSIPSGRTSFGCKDLDDPYDSIGSSWAIAVSMQRLVGGSFVMYDPSPSIGTPPSPLALAAMQRQVAAHVAARPHPVVESHRWGLLGWGLTVCVLLAVFGVLPELLSPRTAPAAVHVDTRTAPR